MTDPGCLGCVMGDGGISTESFAHTCKTCTCGISDHGFSHVAGPMDECPIHAASTPSRSKEPKDE